MDDRVGDLLAERAALDTGAAGGIILSVLLHGAIVGIAVYAALHHPPVQELQMVTIRLAPMTPANAAPSSVAAPARPAPKPLTPKITEPRPEVEQPKPAPVTAKPSKKTAPTSAFGKSSRKGADVPVPPPPVTTAPKATGTGLGAATAGDVPVGSAGVTGIEGDFQNAFYIENMKRLIGLHWFRPQVAPGTTTTIYYEIERDGTVRNAKIETASGNGTADRAALRAVLEASPLSPLPFSYNGTYLGVHLTFK